MGSVPGSLNAISHLPWVELVSGKALGGVGLALRLRCGVIRESGSNKGNGCRYLPRPRPGPDPPPPLSGLPRLARLDDAKPHSSPDPDPVMW